MNNERNNTLQKTGHVYEDVRMPDYERKRDTARRIRKGQEKQIKVHSFSSEAAFKHSS